MESRICLAGEWVSTPAFSIGDAVVHVYDGPRDDVFSADEWLTYWYRGVVIGLYYNRATDKTREFKEEGWVYVVEIEDGCDGVGITNWLTPIENFKEHELKSSRFHARAVDARCKC